MIIYRLLNDVKIIFLLCDIENRVLQRIVVAESQTSLILKRLSWAHFTFFKLCIQY